MAKTLKDSIQNSIEKEENVAKQKMKLDRFDVANKLVQDEKRKEPKKSQAYVRKSFLFTPKDNLLINQASARFSNANHSVNNSDVLRLGLRALAKMKDEDLSEIYYQYNIYEH